MSRAQANAGRDLGQAVGEAYVAHFYLSMFCDLESIDVGELDLGAPPFEPLASQDSDEPDASQTEINSWPWGDVGASEVARLWDEYTATVAQFAKMVTCPPLPEMPIEYARKTTVSTSSSL